MLNPQIVLNKFFNYSDFRSGQLEIIKSILAGQDTMAVMPTGGGKSLCYQIPALLMEGTTIVISPLISLMKDQVDTLLQKKIPAAFINSSQSNDEMAGILHQLKNNNIKLLYLAPERIESKSFIEQLKYLSVPMIAIDEAHCISEWGHDFRPSYRKVHTLKEILPSAIVSAFTATATEDVQEDIVRTLKLRKPQVFIRGFDRPNLTYIVKESKDKSSDIIKMTAGLNGSAIIYAGSRKRVESTYADIKKFNSKATYYHAGLNEKFRKIQQERFINNESNIIVATNAFGMGIDKPDVRKVFHIDLTGTLESYYQESGRAGRDNKESDCVLLYNTGDRGLQDYFINMTYPQFDDIIKVYNFLYDKTKTKVGQTSITGYLGNYNNLALDTKLPFYAVQNIISIFEKYGVVSSGKATNWAYIKINSDSSFVKEYYNQTSEENKPVLEAFLRSVSVNQRNDYSIVYFDELLRKYSLLKDNLDKAIHSFQYNGIIDFRGYKPVESISLLLPRYDNKNIPINFEDLLKRKKNAISKLNKVEEYAQTNKCKRNFLLAYFGEIREHNCNKCSSCLDKKTINTESIIFIKNKLKGLIEETGKNFSKSLSWKILSGSKSREIYSNNFHYLTSYNSLLEITRTEFDKVWGEISSNQKLSQDKYSYTNDIETIKMLVSSKKSLEEIIISTKSKKAQLILELHKITNLLSVEDLFPNINYFELKQNYLSNPNINVRDLQFLFNNQYDFNECKLIIDILKK